MLSTGQKIDLGLRTLAFTALDKSDMLNRFANWITGGKVNRESLSQGILRTAIDLAANYVENKQALGARTATLVPLLRGAMLDNNMERMKQSVADLAREGLSSFVDPGANGRGLGDIGRQAVHKVVGVASAAVAEQLVGDHATEKLVTTLVKQHGWKPLEDYMAEKIGLPGIALSTVKNIVQRAMVDKPAYNMSDNAEYRLAAGVAAAWLTDKNYDTPLRAYAPVTMATIDTAVAVKNSVVNATTYAVDTGVAVAGAVKDGVVNATTYAVDTGVAVAGAVKDGVVSTTTYAVDTGVAVAGAVKDGVVNTTTYAVETGVAVTGAVKDGVVELGNNVIQVTTGVVKDRLDVLQDQLGIEPKPLPPENAFAGDLTGKLEELVIDEGTSQRDVAKALVLEQLLLEKAEVEKLPDTLVVQTIQQENHETFKELADLMSAQQIKPLIDERGGHRGGVQVATTWGGKLDRIEASSHMVGKMPMSALNDTKSLLEAAPALTVSIGGYTVGRAFSQQIKSLDLDLPDTSLGYTDTGVELGKAAFGYGLSYLGYHQGPDLQDSARLKQLYNTCGRNVDVMKEVSRYLDEDLAVSAVGKTMLESLKSEQDGVLNIGGTLVQLADTDNPDISFQLRNEGNFIRVEIAVQYEIAAYGTDMANLREPHGEKASVVTAAASVYIRPSQLGTDAFREAFPLAEVTSIHNELAFDHQTGALL